MTYYGACDGNMESYDGIVRLCRIKIWSNRYHPTTWAKESKPEYYFGQISHGVSERWVRMKKLKKRKKPIS